MHALFQCKASCSPDTDLMAMQIYKCLQLSSVKKGFMSMPQQKVQQLEYQTNAKKVKENKVHG